MGTPTLCIYGETLNRVGHEVTRHLRAHEEMKTHALEVLPVSLLVAKAL